MNELICEKEASKFRNDIGANNNEALVFKSVLRKLNVITFFVSLSDNFSGMAIKVGEGESAYRFVLINSSQSIGKQHFTICHELYHLYIQEDFKSRVCNVGLFNSKDDKTEYAADLFASYLLLPTEGLLSNIPKEEIINKKLSIGTILYLEHYYSCSRSALLYRLKKLKLISSTEYDLFKVNVKRSAAENGYPTSLYEPGNHNIALGDYGQIAKSLYDNDKISESHYYSLLSALGTDLTKINFDVAGE